jgi:GNAT superfamily N-acetyltransferase
MRQLYLDDPGPAPPDEATARKALGAFLREPSFGRAWLICEGETAVGYVILTLGYSLEFGGRDAFVDELFIQREHRGRGWGRRTLEFVEAESGTLGVGALHLAVSDQNAAGYEIYRRAGFVDRGFRLMSKRI